MLEIKKIGDRQWQIFHIKTGLPICPVYLLAMRYGCNKLKDVKAIMAELSVFPFDDLTEDCKNEWCAEAYKIIMEWSRKYAY